MCEYQRTGASPGILISQGSDLDPRWFYSTTYSTHHNTNPACLPTVILPSSSKFIDQPKPSAPRAGGIGGSSLKIIPSLVPKQRTGYTKNVISYLKYDKSIDEGNEFRIENPFLPTSIDLFKPPQFKNYLPLRANSLKIEPIVNTGFTRRPTYNVTRDGFITSGQLSTTKMHFQGENRYSPSKVNKSSILPSASAFVNDACHISKFGNNPEVQHENIGFLSSRTEPLKNTKYSQHIKLIEDNAFSRSSPRDFLKHWESLDDGKLMERTQLSSLKSLKLAEINADRLRIDKIKQNDLAQWAHIQDPMATVSTSNVLHTLDDYGAPYRNDVSHPTSCPRIKAGYKEDTGSVRNNPDYMYLGSHKNPPDQFETETYSRFHAPTDRFNMKNFACESISRSGFSRNNKFNYTIAEPSEQEQMEQMHSSVAKKKWISELGMHTSKSTQQGYILIA
ncbi:hypothetical protein HK096_008646 [Nowakowskiella sp. JEL0078]|nr:hypothetical protein HK096_008646 [Nowakowskiella sp. JEL0078]